MKMKNLQKKLCFILLIVIECFSVEKYNGLYPMSVQNRSHSDAAAIGIYIINNAISFTYYWKKNMLIYSYMLFITANKGPP